MTALSSTLQVIQHQLPAAVAEKEIIPPADYVPPDIVCNSLIIANQLVLKAAKDLSQLFAIIILPQTLMSQNMLRRYETIHLCLINVREYVLSNPSLHLKITLLCSRNTHSCCLTLALIYTQIHRHTQIHHLNISESSHFMPCSKNK